MKQLFFISSLIFINHSPLIAKSGHHHHHHHHHSKIDKEAVAISATSLVLNVLAFLFGKEEKAQASLNAAAAIGNIVKELVKNLPLERFEDYSEEELSQLIKKAYDKLDLPSTLEKSLIITRHKYNEKLAEEVTLPIPLEVIH